jgi:chromosome segregation ATPase
VKKPFETAAEVFRESERNAHTDGGRELARLHQGLALLAEGLRQMEKRLEEVETRAQSQSGNGIANGHRAIRRKILMPVLAPPPSTTPANTQQPL